LGISPLIPGGEADHARYIVLTNPAVDPNAVYVRRGMQSWELEGGWSGRAYAIVWSPDLTRMASPIAVWDTQTGKRIARLSGYNPSDGEDTPRFSLDAWGKGGLYLASAESDTPGGRVVAWNPATGQVVASRNVPSDVILQSIDWLENDPTEVNILALGGFRQDPATGKSHPVVLIWNVNTGEIVNFLLETVQETQATVVAASPDSRWLAVGLEDGEIVLWDRMLDQEQIVSSGTTLNKLVWSPDSQGLAASASDGIIRVYSGKQ
jgi:WD40 repeat protein